MSPHKRAKVEARSQVRAGAKPYASVVPPRSPLPKGGGIVADRIGSAISPDPVENGGDIVNGGNPAMAETEDASWEEPSQSQGRAGVDLPYGGVSTQVPDVSWSAGEDE